MYSQEIRVFEISENFSRKSIFAKITAKAYENNDNLRENIRANFRTYKNVLMHMYSMVLHQKSQIFARFRIAA
jgi:hypothetical protein